MNVKLIAKTQGVGDLSGKSLGEVIAYAARVSNPSNQINHLTAPKLLSYCLKHKHVSIFETCSMTVEVTTSMAIAEQMQRHWSFANMRLQKWSGRYAESECVFEPIKARRQDTKNRQNSLDDLPQEDIDWFYTAQKHVQEMAVGYYKEALNRSIAKECARFLSSVQSGVLLSFLVHGRVSKLHCLCVAAKNGHRGCEQ